MSSSVNKCPICLAAAAEKATRGNVRIYSCPNCKMVFAWRSPKHEAQSHSDTVVDTNPGFYAAVIKNYAQQLKVAAKIVPKRLDAYAKILGRPVASILEIGCGTGAYASAFLEQSIEYRAIDIDPDIVEFASKKTGANIHLGNFITDDIGGPHDVIFASQVFEHVTTPHDFLKKSKSSLASGGILHLDVPNHASVSSAVRKVFSGVDYGFIQPPYHMLAYTPESMDYVLEMNGFANIQIDQFRNDDSTWGQLTDPSMANRLQYSISGFFGRGSLLTAVAQV